MHTCLMSRRKAKASNSCKKSEDIGDASVFNIIDNLMAKGGRMCLSRVGVDSQ